MDRLMPIGETAKTLGVSVSTLRRWEEEGKLVPERTLGGQRRYSLAKIQPHMFRNFETDDRKTIAYARVSSRDQKKDLERQKQVLEMYCASKGWMYEIVSDLGSGMNYHKRGLNKLLTGILNEEVGRVVITHKDRLLRFGAELVFAMCEAKQVEVLIINKGDDASFEEELDKDVLEIVTVFSARLYGSRSRKNKKLLEGIEKALEEADAA